MSAMGRWLSAARTLRSEAKKTQISAKHELTKPTKPGSVSSVSSCSKEIRQIPGAPDGDVPRANRVAKFATLDRTDNFRDSQRSSRGTDAKDKLSVASDVDAQCALTSPTPLQRAVHVAKLATCQPEETLHERAGMAAGGVPKIYLDAWAGFQCASSRLVSADAWQQAIQDAGLLLDQWGDCLAQYDWAAVSIFGPDGLAWFIAGERVRAVGPDHAITASDRVFDRREDRNA